MSKFGKASHEIIYPLIIVLDHDRAAHRFYEAKIDSSYHEYFTTHRDGVCRMPRTGVRRIECREELKA